MYDRIPMHFYLRKNWLSELLQTFVEGSSQQQNQLMKKKLTQYINQTLKMQFENPKTYADLMKMVGNQGKYQLIMAFSFFLISIIIGFSFLGVPFFFHNKQLVCPDFDNRYSSMKCQEYVCQHDRLNLQSYKRPSSIHSIADDFGPFDCQNAQKLIYLRSGVYIGYIFSLGLSIISDNFGRKPGILIAWTLALVGILMTLLAPSIQFVFVGQLIFGMGSSPCYRFAFLFLNQATGNSFRQKVVIIMLLLYSLSMAIVGLTFYLLNDWKLVLICCLFIPSVIVELLIIFFIRETPMFLIKKDQQNSVIQLNKIAKINGKQDVITLQHIRSVIEYNKQTEYFKTIKVSFFDLFTYGSLKWVSIAVVVISAAKAFLNQGPLAIIDTIGFDIFLNAITFGIVEALAVFVIYFFIQNLPRRMTILYVLGVGAACFFILIFVKRNQEQKFSAENVIQFLLMLGSRIIINLYYSVSQLFFGELYPTRIRSLGYGLVSLSVSIFALLAQISVQQFRHYDVNPMIILFFMMCIGFVATFSLPQTLGKQLQDEIVQIQEQKDKMTYDLDVDQHQKY